MSINFVHLAGSKKGRTEVFSADKVRIGRDPSNDLQFDPYQDRDASSRHAEVTREGAGFWISDLGSTNGTFLNGERVTRHALQDGDVIAFGRGGPKLRFTPEPGAVKPEGVNDPTGATLEAAAAGVSDGDGAQDAPAGGGAAVAVAPQRREQRPDGDAARSDIPQPKLPGPNTMKMILQKAARKAKSGQGSSIFGGTATFVKEVIRQARDEAAASVKIMLLFAAVLFLLLFVLVGWLAWELYAKSGELDSTKADLKEMRDILDRDFQDRLRQGQETFERLQAELRTKFERREKELEEKIKEFEAKGEADSEEAERLRRELEKRRSPHVVLQEVARRVRPATYLVYCRYEVRRKPDAPSNLSPAPPYLQGFGSGFAVTPQGHIVTNKHVVKPWLFSRAKAQMDQQHLELKRDPVTGKERAMYAVWKAGDRVMEPGARNLSFFATFNSIVKDDIELLTTAPDQMRNFQTQVTIDGVSKRVSVYAHDPDSLNDVAVLKIRPLPGETVPYMPLASAEEIERLRKGDVVVEPVLVMGFPRGTRVLEEGIANPSPTTGFIRKVERTIHIDASISPGNSGGPVINAEGKVLGIATRIADASAETHGFAVPITKAIELLPKDVYPPK